MRLIEWIFNLLAMFSPMSPEKERELMGEAFLWWNARIGTKHGNWQDVADEHKANPKSYFKLMRKSEEWWFQVLLAAAHPIVVKVFSSWLTAPFKWGSDDEQENKQLFDPQTGKIKF